MRILHVLDHSLPLHSGYTFRTKSIIEQQRALGWETFHITSMKHTEAAKTQALFEEVDGLSFYRTVATSGALTKLPVVGQFNVIASLARRLEEVVTEVRPDVIHAHSPALNGAAALRVGRRHGIPVVYEIRAFWEDAAVDHGTAREGDLRYRLTRALETYVIKRADAITTICEGLRGDIVARGVPSEKVTVIPNAVDIDKFSVSGSADPELKNKYGLDGKDVVGFIGSFYAYEGLPLLVKSFPLILAELPNVKLFLAGGGPQEEYMKQCVADLHLDDFVVFAGRVPHADVQRYYDLVDVFVYPRLSMRLTDLVTPLKPLEAMAQGRIVVASDVGGHRELIQPDVTGVLFKAGDEAALARALVDLLNDKEKMAVMRIRARSFVENERTWSRSVAHYKDVYARVVKAGHK